MKVPALPVATSDELSGIVGFAARVLEALGEVGVGLLTFAETVFPPIPSEVILPLAGFLARGGEMTLWLVMIASTAGSYAGALLLYWLGHRLGEERAIRLLSKLPLVDRSDFEQASAWFAKHGRSAVFFGRLIPGVRSLISLPAGAEKMPISSFSLFTIAGSLLWNGLLVSAGFALGSQYALVERYSGLLNWIVAGFFAAFVVALVIRRVRRKPAERDASD